jgi:CRP-like cAMP-binding protein
MGTLGHVTLGEIRGHAVKLFARGEALHALRCYDAIVAAVPHDYDARMKLADCLVALGERAAAAEVYRAVAWYCAKAGHPLDAVVCTRLIEATTGTPAEEIIAALVTMYGRGSDLLGKVAARLAPPAPDTPIPNPPDLRAPPAADLVAAAAHRARHCLDGFDEFPEALHPIPLLSELSDQAFRRVLQALVVKRLPEGELVIREGEPGTSFFFVAGGEVRVSATDALGHTTELARLHEGSLFGEMALISSQPRTATVQVVGEADLLEIPREALAAIAGELAQVAAALERFTRDRLLKNLVATSPLFRPFSRVQQLDLLRRFSSHDAALGTTIIREGEAGRGLFVVLSGEVEVTKRDELGIEVPLATLKAGDVFGEISLVRGVPSTATVTAARPSTVLFLARDYFARLLEAVPQIRQYFEQLSVDRLLETRLLLQDDQIVEEDERVLV